MTRLVAREFNPSSSSQSREETWLTNLYMTLVKRLLYNSAMKEALWIVGATLLAVRNFICFSFITFLRIICKTFPRLPLASSILKNSLPGMENLMPSLSHKTYLAMWKQQYWSLQHVASVGSRAPSADVLTLDGGKVLNLLNFQSKGRPLVVTFGSCT